MNDNFDDVLLDEEEQEIQEKKEKKDIRSILSIIFAIASLCMVVLLKVIAGFVTIHSGVFFGIMNIIILGLPVAGGILGYLATKNLKSFELVLNVATAMICLIVL